MSDEHGRNRFIIAGTLIGGLALLVVPFTDNAWVLIGISTIYGIGYASVTSSTVALTSDLCTKAGSGSTMGFLNTVMGIGHRPLGPSPSSQERSLEQPLDVWDGSGSWGWCY